MRRSIDHHLASLATVAESAETIEQMAAEIQRVLSSGGKVLTCGNGGSAAEAMHLAEEMIGCFSRDREPMAAICLCADSAAMTCIANDYGYEEMFARQVEGLGRRGDVLVPLSTSGRSPNIVKALRRARDLGMTTIGLLGEAGSPAHGLCDIALTTPAMHSSHIQEVHIVAIHLILEYLDA
ncbi:MAG: SIS domain-containing protein [Phycisphaerae bacterium]|nr:SIS domain-containing protein [Phycisphaerae bacterium]